MIKVALVDDSKTALLALRQTLERDPEILVVGEARNGFEAMRLINRYNPDLVTMDVFLTRENGLDVAARIMTESPRPIIVVTGINPSDPRLIYQAMQRGVLEVFPKLPAQSDPSYQSRQKEFINLVKNLSQVPVVHQRNRRSQKKAPPVDVATSKTRQKIQPNEKYAAANVLLIGASTGGPPVVCQILQSLPKPCPIPIVLVQHISPGFAAGFVEWLSQSTQRHAVLVDKRTSLNSETLYSAPDSNSIMFSSKTHLNLARDEPNGIRPSIDVLFSSAAELFGRRAIAVLLTGMGADGAYGLQRLFEQGAFTLVQTPSSSAVDSMPRAAIAMNAATKVLTPKEIGFTLRTHLV